MTGQPNPAWPADLMWRESWDHHAHAFRAFGELSSTGICTHIAQTSALPDEEAPDSVPKCLACLLVHGRELADRRGIDSGEDTASPVQRWHD